MNAVVSVCLLACALGIIVYLLSRRETNRRSQYGPAGLSEFRTGLAVLGGMDFSGLEMIVFCLTGIAVLFLAAQKGAPVREKRNYTGVFVVLMLSKLGASGWAGDICSALVWPALLATEYERGKPIQRQLQLVSAAEVLRLVFWMLTKYAGMSGLAFWTNIMFVLLTCARGWAGLTLYKTQEETL